MWMMLNHLKTNSAKFAHYRPKIQKVIEFFEFQSLTQHPLYNAFEHHYDTSAVLQGISKAFNKVWNDELLLMLGSNGISGLLIGISHRALTKNRVEQ